MPGCGTWDIIQTAAFAEHCDSNSCTQAIGIGLECIRWSGDGVDAPNMMQ